MADLRELANEIASVAARIAPLIIPGMPGIDAAIDAGKAAIDLIDRFKTTAGMSTPELDAAREILEPKVLQHIEDTARSLD